MHYRVGDVEPMSEGGSSSFMSCNCACTRCLSGSCCQFPTPDWTAPAAWVSTGTTPFIKTTCAATEHDYSVLDPATLFCRKCGTTKAVR